MTTTLWEVRYIGVLATALWRILGDELGTPVRIETCVATVAKGLSLRRDVGDALPGYRVGRAWYNESAFHQLCVLGYLSDARIGMEAITRLEARYVLRSRGAGAAVRRSDGKNGVRPGSTLVRFAPHSSRGSRLTATA